MNFLQGTTPVKYCSQLALGIVCTAYFSLPAYAQSNFLIWPIYPVIENTEKAAPVWLENVGDEASMVQVRVFKWTQKDSKDQYSNQQEIIPSPPIVKVAAGEKQMIRLTKAFDMPQGQESSYRIIIDELPVALEKEDKNNSVSFKMRYSLPLFVYGQGLASGKSQQGKKQNQKNPNARPILTWALSAGANPRLEVSNIGLMNARISGFKINNKDYKSISGNDTFAYVLAGSTMYFDLDQEFKQALHTQAEVYAITHVNVDPILMTKK